LLIVSALLLVLSGAVLITALDIDPYDFSFRPGRPGSEREDSMNDKTAMVESEASPRSTAK
jgi:hypothetical protein